MGLLEDAGKTADEELAKFKGKIQQQNQQKAQELEQKQKEHDADTTVAPSSN